MILIDEVLRYESVAIVGTAKNTGKTECLNFLLRHIPRNKIIGTTSIGVDGEQTDAVTGASKPDVHLYEGMLFATSETHFRERSLVGEILDISAASSSLGHYVTAKVIHEGKIKLSGPSSTLELKAWKEDVKKLSHVDTFIIDGAASRLSSASPSITDAFILCTGAAAYGNPEELIKQTLYIATLASLVKYEGNDGEQLVEISSLGNTDNANIINNKAIHCTGALTDKIIKHLIQRGQCENKIVVRDYTKIFLSRYLYNQYARLGGEIMVEIPAKMLAICINPTAPSGFRHDSRMICEVLSQKIDTPVINLFDYENPKVGC